MNWGSSFTLENSPRADGSYPWAKVGVYNDQYFKGYLNPNLIRKQGPDWAYYMTQFDGPNGPFIKWHRSLVFPWFDGEPVWPFGPDSSSFRTYTH